MLRLLPLLFAFTLTLGAMPAEIEEALKSFRAEGTKGWSFTQTTASGERSLVERYEAARPEFERWTLLQKDGREPTPEEARSYREKLTRRTGGETAPNVKDQIDPDSCELTADADGLAAYRFRLRPGGDDDRSAEFMAVTFTLHRATGVITQVELASTGPFSPVFGVKVQEARTVMTYSLPEGDRPVLLQKITVRTRGRAFWLRSLDDDMTVAYTDHAYAGKRPAPRPAEPARPQNVAP